MDSYCVGEAPYVRVRPQKVENYKKVSAALLKKFSGRGYAPLILWYSSQQIQWKNFSFVDHYSYVACYRCSFV
jgi:hypothetical protein